MVRDIVGHVQQVIWSSPVQRRLQSLALADLNRSAYADSPDQLAKLKAIAHKLARTCYHISRGDC